jgi:hypothetical protein
MGYDLHGEEPISEEGEYFRNNVWWWHGLWEYVCDNCADFMTEEDRRAGQSNDMLPITKTLARKIAERLETLIRTGHTKRYEAEYNALKDALPDEICKHCEGTGQRNDEFVKGECNGCKGKGKVRPFATWYHFSEKNVKEFITFMKASGGFKIG